MKGATTVLAFAVVVSAVRIPDEDQIDQAWGAIEELIEENERLAAKFLRLAFHDCVSPTCDGCINLELVDNGGLDIPIDALESVYLPDGQESEHSDAMTRADFWALAAIVSVEWAIETSNNDYGAGYDPAAIEFVPGREDCATSPDTDEEHDFPSPHLGSVDVFDYFKSHFGFSRYETVALMGGHTIGAATQEHVGFNGTWAGPASRALFHFDGTYHHNLLVHDYGWNFENIGTEENPKWQWRCTDLAKPEDENRDCGFMLDTDISMLVKLRTDSTGMPTCRFRTLADNDCGIRRASRRQMKKYDSSFTENADNNFIQDFAAVFAKVINRM